MVNNTKYNTKITNGQIINGIYSFSSEWVAIISSATASGYSVPNVITQVACDTLIREMKSSGYWALIDSFYNFSYNNTSLNNFSLIDWKNPSRIATANGGMAYQLSGWKGDGSTGYIDLMFNPTVGTNNYSQNNAFVGTVVYDSGSTSNKYTLVQGGSGTNTILNVRNIELQRLNNNGSLATAIDLSGLGFKALGRLDSSNLDYTNLNVNGTSTMTSVTVASGNYVLYRTVQLAYTDPGVSCTIIGQYISQPFRQLFRASYNKYLLTIGQTQIA